MKKRLLPLLVLVLLLTTASAAMATHCQVCGYDRENDEFFCRATVSIAGYTWCESDGPTCVTSGVWCSPHGFAPALASEYVVATVERLDEPPQPQPREPVVATVERPATR